MLPTLLVRRSGKLRGRCSPVAAGAGEDGTLLYAHDSLSGTRFLCDTGAHSSMVPATSIERTGDNVSSAGRLPQLVNVSGESVRVYGWRYMELCFGGRTFGWNFVTADTSFHILGADFLRSHGLLVDLKNRCLVDTDTLIAYTCTPSDDVGAVQLATAPVAHDTYRQLLAEFPKLSDPGFSSSTPPHGVEHFIATTGPPVHARAASTLPSWPWQRRSSRKWNV